MRYLTERMIYLFAASLLLPLWPAGDADAQFNGALRGDYDMSIHRTCASALSIDPGTFSSPGDSTIPAIVLKGALAYNGTGGGTFVGESLARPDGNNPVIARATSNCSVTYTVNASGTFEQSMNCNHTFTIGGPGGNNTATLSGIVLDGHISLDGTVLVFGDTTPNVETFTP